MSFFTENCSMYLSDCLNYPVSTKCSELSRLIDCGSIKDLHDFFPTLVKSIFGTPGWGLRTITREANPVEFEFLYSFFIPLGPMMRLCYRLLSEPINFEVSIESLPTKTIQMLNSGRYSVFYADILNIDPYRRQVASLQLNAFDYFMYHFVVHGIIPLHRMFPAALTVHNDHLKTVYFFLTADYLCTFLPVDPNTTVQPTNVFCSVKSTTAMPLSPIMPMRQPKYLSSGAISHNFTSNASNLRTPESSRTSCWRTETVLHFFTDIWLRFDVDDNPDLPSSEFIRVVRVLVKQLHAFANSAELDISPMASLRTLAQPMMSAQMNVFLRGIIHRWPLDSSFSVVLELWLSYIQPWRYTMNREYGIEEIELVGHIPSKYEKFIFENSTTYTQIFIQLLPRFERLDFGSLKNVSMLLRLAKVFGQSNLAYLLRLHDMRLFNEHISSPIKPPLSLNVSSERNTSPSPTNLLQQSSDVTDFYESINTSGLYAHRTAESNYLHNTEDIYVCMFGPNIVPKLEQFVNKIFIAHQNAKILISKLEAMRQKRYSGLLGYIKWYLLSDEEAETSQILADTRKITEILKLVLETFANIFQNELPDLEEAIIDLQECSYDNQSRSILNETIASDNLNHSESSTRATMLQRVRTVEYRGDPAILPAQSNEIAFLVRLFYKLSNYFNQSYADEFNKYYRRTDFIGRIVRHLLEAPRKIEKFEKTNGVSHLVTAHIGPRINLRWLASYRTAFILILSLLVGKFLFGGSLFGIFLLVLLKFITIFVLSTYDFVVNT